MGGVGRRRDLEAGDQRSLFSESRVGGSGGVEESWVFKERPGFKPLFSLVCRCRWNVLCVQQK